MRKYISNMFSFGCNSKRKEYRNSFIKYTVEIPLLKFLAAYFFRRNFSLLKLPRISIVLQKIAPLFSAFLLLILVNSTPK